LRQYYRLEGNDNKPVVVLSHSLGCDHMMWDAQVDALTPHFLVLRYDTRGHGASEVSAGNYRIEMLASDALELIDALGIQRFAWCGLSLGGMIGQQIAANVPGRLTNLILANTSPHMDASAMETRRRTVLEQGINAIAETVMGRFFMAE